MIMINLTPAGCDSYGTEPAQAVLLLNAAASPAQKLGLAMHLTTQANMLASMSADSQYASEQDLKAALSSVGDTLEQVLAILHDAAKGITQPGKVEV